MNIASVINFLLVAGAIQGFLFNFITLTLRKKYGPVVLYLNLVVLFISLNNLQAWLPTAGYSSDIYFIKELIIPWYLMIFPCFYSFLRHFLGVEDKVRGFVRIGFILLGTEILLRSGVISWAIQSGHPNPDGFIEQYNVLEETVNIIFSLTLFALCFRLVFRKEALYRDFLDFDDVRWIKVFLILGIAISAVWCIGLTLRAAEGFQDGTIYYPLRLATSLMLYWISYQGLYRYTIVQERVHIRRSIRGADRKTAPRAEEARQRLEEKQSLEYQRIQDYILGSQRYLDPLLSLNTLAEEVSISPGHLSRLINKYGNTSFTDFINGFRVAEAKKIIRDPDFRQYTVVAIGLECGFNSKSTFYSAFKKFTDQSHSAYKDQK